VSETANPSDPADLSTGPSLNASFDSAGPIEPDAEEVPDVLFRRFDCTAPDEAALAVAADAARVAIEGGECVVLPTDTVYGIGADAFNSEAVQRLLDAKRRGRDMPPPVLIAEPALIRALAVDVPQPAKDLIDRHWPGPLTVICKAQPSLRMDLGETGGTIALRVPDHSLVREILKRTGPMAVSSANISGQAPARTCDEAVDQLGDRVSVYLDGGSLTATAASTIVDFTQSDGGAVLRHGVLSVELLRETCPDLEDLATPEPRAPEPADAAPADASVTKPAAAEPGAQPSADTDTDTDTDSDTNEYIDTDVDRDPNTDRDTDRSLPPTAGG
jgi:tRNA threonylcarbamoyl adenosine modification protein (Sua5/YciO/YrdC/YwlC family)